jgi:hypothetical protein
MPDYGLSGWLVIVFCAFVVGFSKTGLPGAGILAVPLMASVVDARESVGLLLGILIIGDLFAAFYWRRRAEWGHLVRLLPAALVGIVAGFFTLGRVSTEQLGPMIGGIVLVMLVLHHARQRFGFGESLGVGRWFAIAMGLAAGVTTMMANAAGPVVVLYLLAMGLEKEEFVGTSAWFFFLINWIKVPFMGGLGLMTFETLKVDAMCVVVVAAGAVCGIYMVKRINQGVFKAAVEILAAASAVRLLF